MVSSSKKKRGKQRKAKQQITTSTSAVGPDQDQVVVVTPKGTYIHPNHHKLMTQYFRRGDDKATEILTSLTSEDVPTNGISWPNISLDQSGIVSSAIYFLKQCEDETFDKALADARDSVSAPRPRGGHISFVGGDLKSPSLWITILRKAIDSSGITSAIFRIRPMVICMCNDTDRLFYKSDIHWRESITSFVQLVSDMISNSTDKRVGKWLLVNERLLASIVQWNFWDAEHRPDIVDVLSVEK